MRLRGLHLRNIGPFADARLNLEALSGPIVALVGPNGAGKSTMLSLGFAGALYRDGGDSGTIAERANARDSCVHTFVDDLEIQHFVDAHTGKGESLVRRGDAVLLESGSVRDFDAWAKRNLPAPELFFASVFGAQGSTGFAGLGAAERKRVVLRALGVERVEAKAERAREREREARESARTLAARLADAEKGQSAADAQTALDAAHAELERAERDLEARRAELVQAREEVAAAERAQDALATWSREEARARGAVEEAARRGADLRARRAQLAQGLAGADADREEAAKLGDLREELAEAEEGERKARASQSALAAAGLSAELVAAEEEERAARDEEQAARAAGDAAAAEQRAAGAARTAAERAHAEAERQRRRAEQTIEVLAGAERAEERLPALRAAATTAKEAVDAQEAEIGRLRKVLIGGMGQRIEGLRGGLERAHEEAASSAPDLSLLSLGVKETLAVDDALDAEQSAAPAAQRAAETKLSQLRADLTIAERNVREVEALAARRPELTAAREEVARARAASHAQLEEDERQAGLQEAAGAARQAAEERALAAAARARAAAARLALLRAAAAAERGVAAKLVEAWAERVQEIRRDVAAAEQAQGRLASIAGTQATIAAIDTQIADADRAIEAARAAVAALAAAPVVPIVPDVDAAERAVRVAEHEARRFAAVVAQAEHAVSLAQEREARAATLREELCAAEQRAADWALVAKGLGKEGVQALLIDAAGPELTAIVNDLLRSCYGARFTVTISTTRPKADGKGDREVCDVLVYDAESRERERERDVRRYSGGERVILGEALALALSLLSCRRAGLEGVTLVRDETAGQLDPEHGPAYVAMLRRAAEIVRAAHVLFVSHTPALWKLADCRVLVRGGELAVEGADEAAIESPQLALEEAREAA